MINTPKHLSYTLKTRPASLQSILSNISEYYDEKRSIKMKEGYPQIKNGIEQTRLIHASRWQLKDIQKRILKNILNKLNLPNYAYGSIADRSNILNAKQHVKNKYFLLIDLENFFPSLNNSMVFKMFRSLKFSPTISRSLTKLTTFKRCLPQGPPTSSMISNLVFVKTGLQLQEFANKNNLTFTTFLDDLTFSSSEDFENKIPAIIQILEKEHFKISLDKTVYTDKEPVVTGILIKDKRLQLTDTYMRKLLNPVNYNAEQREAHKPYFNQVEAANN